MTRKPLHSDVQFVRDSRLPGVELRTCSYREQAFRPHTHESYSVALIESGATMLDMEGACASAIEGDIVVISPQVAHACNPDPEISYRLFYLEPDWFEEPAEADRADTGRSERDSLPQIRHLIHDPKLFAELRSLHEDVSDHRVDAETTDRLEACLHQMLHEYSTDDDVGSEDALVVGARRYLEERWHEPVSLDELAHAVGTNRYRLLRRFKRATGLTPHAYHVQLRVEQARRALADGEPISRVALDAGFADQSHFTRVFRAHTGATPRQYQNARTTEAE